MSEENRCKCATCTCLVAEDQEYCSTYCEAKGEVINLVEIDCGCGHAECAGDY